MERSASSRTCIHTSRDTKETASNIPVLKSRSHLSTHRLLVYDMSRFFNHTNVCIIWIQMCILTPDRLQRDAAIKD